MFASAIAEPEYLSVSEVAHLLRVSKASVYRAVERGEFRRYVSRRWARSGFPRAALEVPAGAPRTAIVAAVEPPAHGGGMEVA